ncbi:MAG: sulfite exporter TauE/SafE family protein [Saprospiraceae bacterium]|nr:sulfite exporter TauE/SafE family protein [Saprospiraceae bacterium]
MTPLWTALIMGLAGSLHCVGMCGPLALSLPGRGGSVYAALGASLLYNTGRIATYSALGAIIGALGRVVWMAGLQAYLGMALGILLLLAALLSLNVEFALTRWAPIQKLYRWVSSQFGAVFRRGGWSSYFYAGLLNGLLPCGLVYLAIAGAMTTSSWGASVAYMAFFGAGTLPLMAATALGGQFITPLWRTRLRRITPFFLLLMAGLLLYRSIFYLLPQTLQLWEDMQNPPMCH